jgi:hypothetical protein
MGDLAGVGRIVQEPGTGNDDDVERRLRRWGSRDERELGERPRAFPEFLTYQLM